MVAQLTGEVEQVVGEVRLVHRRDFASIILGADKIHVFIYSTSSRLPDLLKQNGKLVDYLGFNRTLTVEVVP